MERLTELFCLIDDFCRLFEPIWEPPLLETEVKKRQWSSELSLSGVDDADNLLDRSASFN